MGTFDSEDSDEMLYSVTLSQNNAFHQGLHCLL